MSAIEPSVETELAFFPARHVSADTERPGLLRARTRPPALQNAPESYDRRRCRVRAWEEDGDFRPDLLRHGFDCIDLSDVDGLRGVLERVRDAGHVEPEDAREVRRRMAGNTFRLGDGSRLRLLFIAPEGFIMRKAGPDGLPVSPPGSMTEMNDHDAATAVHADQDILGTPLRQLLRGFAPWLFRHDAPDSRNRWSPLLLLNLWVPLQQITRPLVLMDKGSLNRRAHQLRYGLPTDAFLDRDPDQRVNDIWTFLYDDAQRWYFRPELPLGRAYVFETLGTPHGSCVVPGEALAASRYRQLAAAGEAIARGDEAGLRRCLAAPQEPATGAATLPLRRAIEAMDARIEEARRDASLLCASDAPDAADAWRTRAARAMDAVVRKSLEMRVVALRLPTLRPRRRARPALNAPAARPPPAGRPR